MTTSTNANVPRGTPVPPATTQDTYDGTSGDDFFAGTFGPDVFNMQDGGSDEAYGGFGDDVFNFGGTLNSNDFVGGGPGYDTLTMTSGVADLRTNMTGIEEIDFVNVAGHQSFSMTLGASNVSAGQTLKIDGHDLTSDDIMLVYGNSASPVVGNLILVGGAGYNAFEGGGRQ